jgi:hypothetical protein
MLRRSTLFCAVSALTLACGDGGTEPDIIIDGSYELVSVDGQALPHTQDYGEGYLDRVNSGGMVISGTAVTYTLSISMSVNGGESWVDEEFSATGTLTRSGNSLSLTFPPAQNPGIDPSAVWSGTWDGADRLTLQIVADTYTNVLVMDR